MTAARFTPETGALEPDDVDATGWLTVQVPQRITPSMTAEAAKSLREPFPASAVGKLPKGGTTLDYVGHAAVTDRLLSVDPLWSWEPVAYAEDGGPLIRLGAKEAELWVRLTVCGVTRIGVGTAPLGAFELAKQLVSDAIRNAAMRFGVALDLWAKEDLHAIQNAPKPATTEQVFALDELLAALDDEQTATLKAWWRGKKFPALGELTEDQARLVLAHGATL